MTTREIAEELGKHKSSTGKTIKFLYDAGYIYISGWVRGEDTDGDAAPRYKIKSNDSQKDRSKPTKITKSEMSKRYWRSHRKILLIPKLTGSRSNIWTGLVKKDIQIRQPSDKTSRR